MLIHVLMHLKAGSFTSGPLQQVIKSLWRLCSSNRHTDLSAFRPQNPRSFVTDEHPGRARKGVPLFVLDCLNYTHQKNNGTRNMEEHMKRTHGKKNMISVFFPRFFHLSSYNHSSNHPTVRVVVDSSRVRRGIGSRPAGDRALSRPADGVHTQR